MHTERWDRMWQVFHAALEQPLPERVEFVRASCEDQSLCREVEELLDSHDAHTELLDRPAVLLAEPKEPVAPPDQGLAVGPYTLERLLGEGGMGMVFAARQEEPIRRLVALKLIRPGHDSREVVTRFESERQTIALMSHPNIARVHDAGATADGRPYFVMELVDGLPITHASDQHRLTVRERLELFVPVCLAVQHAHQKGIIHRDLKPSNVLVVEEDGRLVPKVIDFGIAKALEGDAASAVRPTLDGALVGTPESMSPEQAAASDVDTRADVYSLGVLLYELLCGGLPFGTRAATPGGLLELRRRILEDLPPNPSAQILPADPKGVAKRRRTDPAALARTLRGELDWIVMKALERDRERRYASASELAADLERYLRAEPVSAARPSRLYRLRKVVARHRLEATAVAVVLLLIVGFGLAMGALSLRLSRALTAEERQRATATSVSAFLVELLEQSDPAVAQGATVTVREVLDAGASKVARELGDQPEVQATLLATMGRVYLQLGLYDQAAPLLERSLEVRRSLDPTGPAVAESLHRLGELALGRARYGEARERAAEALAIRESRLPARDAARADTLDLLAVIERETANPAAAQRLHRRALEIKLAADPSPRPAIGDSHNFLGIAARRLGDYAAAEREYRSALEIWRATQGERHPNVAMALNNLALLLHVRGDHEASRALFAELIPLREAVIGPRHPDLLVTRANLAKLLYDMGDPQGAASEYRETLAISREVHGPHHTRLGTILAELARCLIDLGELAEARRHATESLAQMRAVFGDDSVRLALPAMTLAAVEAHAGRVEESERLAARALELLRIHHASPTATAEMLLALGRLRLERGDAAAAESPLTEAVELLRSGLPAGDRRIAVAASALGACVGQLGRLDEAAALLRDAEQALATPVTPDTQLVRARLAEVVQPRGEGAVGPR